MYVKDGVCAQRGLKGILLSLCAAGRTRGTSLE